MESGKEKHIVEIEIKWKKSERPESKRRVFFDEDEDIENPEDSSEKPSGNDSDNIVENKSKKD